MTEKASKPSSSEASLSPLWPTKPVPMKFFGAWEVDKTPANCIPRLCTLTVTKLALLKHLGPDFSSLMVAVKMQSSKRTLRSNEIRVPGSLESPTTNTEVELDLTFTLQYPHFLKKGGNQLHILLQRRKRYKNRAILGFKTLAAGLINMSEVLQRSNCMEKELDLRGCVKDLGKNEVVARIGMSTLKSQPIDQEVSRRHGKLTLDRSTEGDSEDDVDDFTSNEEGSDSEAVEDNAAATNTSVSSTRDRVIQWRRQVNGRKTRKFRNIDSLENGNAQQRNFKQKLFSLLKKLRFPDQEAFESEEQYQEALEQAELMAASSHNDNDIEDFLEEEDIDELSAESGNELDDISISSTPKPSLKPFFSTCTLVGPETDEDANTSGTRHSDVDCQEMTATDQTPYNPDTSLKPIDDIHKKSSQDKDKKSKLFSRNSSGEPITA
ncbi:Phosphofurin acidic cluster sorting protein 2-like protein [Leptotrombidium deliense]|uniref:Phosphofurin acidic cluster sorting protein 2-like protein n=1 Tax=Leptotrombidium deliense TaxID=299467 RepID=A0A443SRF3_9ACAR|nr:Phosphofurin acidic cluster sorting protein 2-like protein [Leptotrombidium deliense]